MLRRSGRRGYTAAAYVESARLLGPAPVWRAAAERRRTGVLGTEARNAVYGRLWRNAASAANADFHDGGGGFFELRRRDRRVRVFQQMTTIDDVVTLRLALDKPRVHDLLARAGVPVPDHVAFTLDDPAPALELLREVGRCVIKPASGAGGGDGVIAGVQSRSDLLRAALVAARFDDLMLAEREGPGALHRFLFLDGELLDVIVDRPPHVVGDGRSTVEELIARENRRRLAANGEAGLELLELELDTALTLRRQGVSLRDVPAPGRRIQVKSISNDHCLEDSVTHRDEIDPDVGEHAAAAVRAVELRLAGVDVIAPRIDRPLAETGGVVLEINGTPGIHRHYQVADRESATPVAVPILERLLD